MKNLDVIKEDLRSIQMNFNPEKATYKVFDKLINENFTIDQMIGVLARVRGVDKFPDELKRDFFQIVNDLKVLKEKEARIKLDNERRLKEKLSQEEHTKELKDIINNLEKKNMEKFSVNDNNLEKTSISIENKVKTLKEVSCDNQKDSDEVVSRRVVKEKEDDLLENYEPKTIPQKIFIVLLVLVIITFIIMLLLFFFY